jgi:hypothetical protein
LSLAKPSIWRTVQKTKRLTISGEITADCRSEAKSIEVRSQRINSALGIHAASGMCRVAKLLQNDPLVSEEPALPADAAAISGESSISADDPVARNHNGNRVCGIGQADRTDGFRPAELARQRPITQRCTGLDRSDCRPPLASG